MEERWSHILESMGSGCSIYDKYSDFSRFRDCQSPILLFYTVVFTVSCWSDFTVSFFRGITGLRTGLGFYASTSILIVNMTLVTNDFMLYKYSIDSDRGCTTTLPPYE